jgi:hypothetical protein
MVTGLVWGGAGPSGLWHLQPKRFLVGMPDSMPKGEPRASPHSQAHSVDFFPRRDCGQHVGLLPFSGAKLAVCQVFIGFIFRGFLLFSSDGGY